MAEMEAGNGMPWCRREQGHPHWSREQPRIATEDFPWNAARPRASRNAARQLNLAEKESGNLQVFTAGFDNTRDNFGTFSGVQKHV